MAVRSRYRISWQRVALRGLEELGENDPEITTGDSPAATLEEAVSAGASWRAGKAGEVAWLFAGKGARGCCPGHNGPRLEGSPFSDREQECLLGLCRGGDTFRG